MTRLFKRAQSYRLRVVLYHHISDTPSVFCDRLGVTVSPSDFESHLVHFARNYDVVDLGAVLHGRLTGRPLLITFDDAYRSVLEVAAPILRRHRLPALFLVCAGQVGGDLIATDNLLCYLAGTVGLARLESGITGRSPECTSVRELIMRVVSKLDYQRHSSLSTELVERYAVPGAILEAMRRLLIGPRDLRDLAVYGVEVGNHTLSHVFCRHLDAGAIRQEIIGAKTMLERWTGTTVRSFSVPYGSAADLTDSVLLSLRESGHEAIFTVRSRRNPPDGVGPVLDRVSMRSGSARRVLFSLEVFPWLRSLRDFLKKGLRQG
jgi:peptidoglycan/xylan/chitin deacetylase (PgdA/CDA1 family)